MAHAEISLWRFAQPGWAHAGADVSGGRLNIHTRLDAAAAAADGSRNPATHNVRYGSRSTPSRPRNRAGSLESGDFSLQYPLNEAKLVLLGMIDELLLYTSTMLPPSAKVPDIPASPKEQKAFLSRLMLVKTTDKDEPLLLLRFSDATGPPSFVTAFEAARHDLLARPAGHRLPEPIRVTPPSTNSSLNRGNTRVSATAAGSPTLTPVRQGSSVQSSSSGIAMNNNRAPAGPAGAQSPMANGAPVSSVAQSGDMRPRATSGLDLIDSSKLLSPPLRAIGTSSVASGVSALDAAISLQNSSKLIDVAILAELRHLRRKPEAALRNPGHVWALLIRAAADLERAWTIGSAPLQDITAATAPDPLARRRQTSSDSSPFVAAANGAPGTPVKGASGAPPLHPHRARADSGSAAHDGTPTAHHQSGQQQPQPRAHLSASATSVSFASSLPFSGPGRPKSKSFAETAVGLASGGGPGIRKGKRVELTKPLRRQAWMAIVPRYLPVIGDRYSAAAVFDALTDGAEPFKVPVIVSQLAPQHFHTPLARDNAAAADASGPGSTLWRARSDSAAGLVTSPPAGSMTPSSSALPAHGALVIDPAAAGRLGSGILQPTSAASASSATVQQPRKLYTMERVLLYDVFEKYCSSLARPLVTPPAAWESLREVLDLDSREMVVKVEEFIECAVTVRIDVQMPRAPPAGTVKAIGPSPNSSAPAVTAGKATATNGGTTSSSSLPSTPTLLPAHLSGVLPLSVPEQLEKNRQAALASPIISMSSKKAQHHRHHSAVAAAAAAAKSGEAGQPRTLRQFIAHKDALTLAQQRAEYYDSDVTAASSDETRHAKQAEKGSKAAASSEPASGVHKESGPITTPPVSGRGKRRAKKQPPVRPRSGTDEASDVTGVNEARADDNDEDGTASVTSNSGSESVPGAEGNTRAGSDREAYSDDHDSDDHDSDSEDSEGDDRGQSHTGSDEEGGQHSQEQEDTEEDDEEEEEEEEQLQRELDELYEGIGTGSDDDDGEHDEDGEGEQGAGDGVGDGVGRRPSGGGLAGRLARLRKATSPSRAPMRPSISGVASWIRNRGTKVIKGVKGVGAKVASLQSITAYAPLLSSVAGPVADAYGPIGKGIGAAGAAGAIAGGGKADPLAPFRGYGVHPDILASLLTVGRAVVRLRGTLVLTDRNLYFHAQRGEVLVVPLTSVDNRAIRLVRTEVKTLGMRLGREADNGLRLGHCELRRVLTDPDAEAAGYDIAPCRTELSSLFRVAAALRGSKVKVKDGLATFHHILPRAISTARSSQPSSAGSGAGGDSGTDGRRHRGSSGFDEDDLLEASSDYGGAGSAGGETPLSAASSAAPASSSVCVPPKLLHAAGSSGTTKSASADKDKGKAAEDDPSAAVLCARPSLTLIFSQLKDLVLGKGQERVGGGRRRVIHEALLELLAAHAIAPGFEEQLRQLVAAHQAVADGSAAAEPSGDASASSSSSATAPAAAAATDCKAQPSSAHPSPYLLAAATGQLSASALLHRSSNMAHLKALLQRNPADASSFPLRLPRYAALNLVRTRALLKATGKCFATLHLCSQYLQQHPVLAGSDAGATNTAIADAPDGGSGSSGPSSASSAGRVIRAFMLQDDPRPVLAVLAWACHDRDVRRRRFESRSTFDRLRFSREMATTLDLVVTPINRLRHMVHYVISWERPLLSAAVLTGLLCLVWFDLLVYALPIWLGMHIAGLLVYGALPESARMAVAGALGRDRDVKANGLLERLRNFRSTLGNNQARLHRLNTAAQRLRSLYTWRDPLRTQLFLAALTLAAAVAALVPSQWLFTAGTLFLFSKPLRSPGKGVVSLSLERFWFGLPVPSVSDPVYQPGMIDDSRVLYPAGLAPVN